MRLYWCMEKILKNPVLMYNGRDAYYLCRNYLGTSYKNAKGGQRCINMDLTFLTDSYLQQILQQLGNAKEQEMQKKNDFRFDRVLSAKENASGALSAKAKDYTAYLKETYGNVTVRSVGRDQRSMDNLGMNMMTDQIRLDLTGERGVLNDRGTEWISALAYMGGNLK